MFEDDLFCLIFINHYSEVYDIYFDSNLYQNFVGIYFAVANDEIKKSNFGSSSLLILELSADYGRKISDHSTVRSESSRNSI